MGRWPRTRNHDKDKIQRTTEDTSLSSLGYVPSLVSAVAAVSIVVNTTA